MTQNHVHEGSIPSEGTKTKGLWDQLTPEQKKGALSYVGPEVHGDPAFLRNKRGSDADG